MHREGSKEKIILHYQPLYFRLLEGNLEGNVYGYMYVQYSHICMNVLPGTPAYLYMSTTTTTRVVFYCAAVYMYNLDPIVPLRTLHCSEIEPALKYSLNNHGYLTSHLF